MSKIRRVLPALVMIGVVALSGCVYWRLLQFKKQFSDFHENFEFRNNGRYALIIKQPLLSGEDVDFLMKAAPTRKESETGEISRRLYVFHLDGGEGPASVLDYDLRFDEDLFEKLVFPEEFADLFPEDVLVAFLTSLGDAETDRRSEGLRAMILKDRVRELMPSRERVLEVLGKPSEKWRERDGLDRLYYRYELETESTGLKPYETRAFGRFHYEGQELRKVDASFAGHVFSFEIP